MRKVFSCTAVVPLVCAALATPGSASATPSLVGKTYAKAAETLSGWKLDFEVATTVGTELQRDDCIVINQVLRSASRFGQENTPAKLLLSLNCNASVASATQAGNSAGSPEGRTAKKEELAEEWRQNTADGQAWCEHNKRLHPNWDWSAIKGCPE